MEHHDETLRQIREFVANDIVGCWDSSGYWVVGIGRVFGLPVYKKRLVDRPKSNILSRLRTLPRMPKEFQLWELRKVTNNFNEKRRLGQGGYDVVYRGVLLEDSAEICEYWSFLVTLVKFLVELGLGLRKSKSINLDNMDKVGQQAYYRK
ncbi:hypothetical protein E3N88_20684 [Mikania micrantha]|uniref:Protein kinase domain-containing protein n=1 Tax=Mikania micrantha TaxID=192012 RepID=A0A5N6NHQ7_9ASTR|nr:hypothetical protein E3N88_20684 [Mikania micrantha]